MNLVDIILGLILVFGLINGYKRGLFIEITSLLGLILGVYGAIHFSFYLANLLRDNVSWDPSLIQIVSFAGTFLIILIALVMLGKILTKIAETILLGYFNKILGGVFGIIKVGLILSVVLIIFSQLNKTLKFLNTSRVEQSVLFDPVKNFAPTIFPKLVTVIDETNKK